MIKLCTLVFNDKVSIALSYLRGIRLQKEACSFLENTLKYDYTNILRETFCLDRDFNIFISEIRDSCESSSNKIFQKSRIEHRNGIFKLRETSNQSS